MANSIVNTIVDQLQTERARLEHELHRVSAALGAFGKAYMQGSKAKAAAPAPKRRMISAAGRKRIAAAQKARWAKIRAAKKSKSKA
ncbi:MAG: hypothetical protein WBV46_01230 [Terriglobales bacterium]